MAANPWQLRADVTALDAAARTWSELAAAIAAAADELVATAQRAFTSGWQSMSAEGYDAHRKQVVGSLDGLALVARSIADTLAGISGSLAAAQRNLDREWAVVALVPHTVVGEEQMVVFSPESPEQTAQVERARTNAAGIRRDLDDALYGDADTLRRAKTEFDVTTRQWGDVVSRGAAAIDVLGWMSGGTAATGLASTTVAGETQSGGPGAGAGAAGGAGAGSGAPTVGSYAPVSVGFDAPSLGGAGLAGAAALAAAARGARRTAPAQAATGTGALGAAPMAGAAAGGGRGGAAMTGGSGVRSSARPGTASAGATRDAAVSQDAREAKERAIAERRAAREARRAAREAKRAAAAKPVVNIVDDD